MEPNSTVQLFIEVMRYVSIIGYIAASLWWVLMPRRKIWLGWLALFMFLLGGIPVAIDWARLTFTPRTILSTVAILTSLAAAIRHLKPDAQHHLREY